MLSVITVDDSEKWDNIVRSFADYDVYYLSGYVKAFQIHGDGSPILFYYEGVNARGINIVMLRDIAEDPHFVGMLPTGSFFDIATPYGYGGWLIEGEETTALFEEYEKWVQQNGVISEFVRFHPLLKNHERCTSYYNVIRLGEVVHMDLLSPEDIWNNMVSERRTRIRKAVKNGVNVFHGNTRELYKQFRIIYEKTMDSDSATKYYYFEDGFYDSLLGDLPYNAQVFIAEYEGKDIASCIVIGANGKLSYHLGGALKEYNSLSPINLLLYDAAKWGSANGYRTLLLGGGIGSAEDNLFKFKRAFYKGELNRFNIGKKVFDQEKYEKLISLRDTIESNYFPAYRA